MAVAVVSRLGNMFSAETTILQQLVILVPSPFSTEPHVYHVFPFQNAKYSKSELKH
jgi:UDP-N-acetylglucosamine:LPS N-acetylglucosamine transferase